MGPKTKCALFAVAFGAGCTEAPSEPVCAMGSRPAPRDVGTALAPPRLEPVTVEDTIADDGTAMGPPMVAWDGTAWNVAWGAHFLALDVDGRPRGEIEERREGGAATGFDPGGCWRGIAAAGDRPGQSVVAWIDAGGTIQSLATIQGIEADLARGESRWWIAAVVSPASDELPSDLALYTSEDASEVGPPIERVAGMRISSPRIVATDVGATLMWIDAEGVVMRSIDRTDENEARTVRVMSANIWARGAIEAVVLERLEGDRIVIGASDGSIIHVAIADPITQTIESGPIAVARSTARGARPGLAPIPERGLVAVCHPAGPGPWGGPDVQDRVELVLVDARGEPVARAVEIARGGTVHAVACGWNGRELLIAWSRQHEGREQIAARRIRLRDDTPILLTHAR